VDGSSPRRQHLAQAKAFACGHAHSGSASSTARQIARQVSVYMFLQPVHQRAPGGAGLWNAAAVLRCEECWCVSVEGRGWLAFIAYVPEEDDPPVVATYCPPCAERELGRQQREPGYT
jgi:hypothetical protein